MQVNPLWVYDSDDGDAEQSWPGPSPVRVLCADCGAVLAELLPTTAEHTSPAYAWAVCLQCGHSQRYGHRVESA